MNDRSLRELMALPLAVRAAVLARALWSGVQATNRRGQGGTFRELREYRPGDPLKALDWRASARQDRWLVREVDRISHLRIAILVDRSASMRYGDDETSKAENARTLAAAFALHAARQGHAISLWNETEAPPTRSGRSAAARIVAALANDDIVDFRLPPLDQAPRRVDLLLVLSDFFDAASTGQLRDLALLSAQRQEVRLLHVLHPDEVEFGFRSPRIFVPLDGAGEPDRQLLPRDVRRIYLENLQRHIDDCEAAAKRDRLHYARHLAGRGLIPAATYLATGQT